MSGGSSCSQTPSRAIPTTRRVVLADGVQLPPGDYSTTPGGTLFSTTPGGTRIIYDRKFLMECRNSPVTKTPPRDLPTIPGVTSPTGDEPPTEARQNHLRSSPEDKPAGAPEARVRRAATREATAVKSLSPATREELPLAATSSNTDPAQPKIKKLLFFKRIERWTESCGWSSTPLSPSTKDWPLRMEAVNTTAARSPQPEGCPPPALAYPRPSRPLELRWPTTKAL
uniref:Eukaryotic translation initiation factor 4E binding protein 1 n=1 Tax=Bos taurus TaxID=9913 RepID=A0AAA9TK13_BOVIN